MGSCGTWPRGGSTPHSLDVRQHKMKTKLRIVMTLVGLMGLTTLAADNSPVTTLFNAMRSGEYQQSGFFDFPALGTNDISELLEHTSRTNQLTRLPVNGASSIHKFSCSEGIVALWLIEGIRVGGRFPSQVPECYDRNKTIPSGALFYAEADQDVVAKAYRSWWEKTKGQTKDSGPLDRTTLTWFGGRTPEEGKR